MFFAFLAFFKYENYEKRDFKELKVNLWDANKTTEVSWWSTNNACTRDSTKNTITCKAGTGNYYTFWRYVIKNVPDGLYNYVEIGCKGKGKGRVIAGLTIGKDGFHIANSIINIGEKKNITFKNPINNNLYIQLSFAAESATEDVVYEVPEIRFLYYSIATKEIVPNESQIEGVPNGKVYTAHVTKKHGPIRLYSVMLKNYHNMKSSIITPVRHYVGSYATYMEVPILSNATHILGMSVLDESYLHGWTAEYAMYEGVQSIVLALYAEARNDKGFDISYYFVKQNTKSWRDAMEKWHSYFPKIYNVQPYGTGAWIPWSDVKSEGTCANEDQLINIFNGKFQWGYHLSKGSTKIPFFGYIEPTRIHNFVVNFSEKTCETDVYNAMLKGDKAAEMIWKYGIKDRNGKRAIENGFFKTHGLMCQVMWSDELYEYQNNFLVRANNKRCVEASGKNCSGIALDSTSPGAVTFDLTQLEDSMPYYLIESEIDEKKKFLPQTGGYFKLMKQYSDLAPNGYMMNSHNAPQQLTKYVASVGWETSLASGGKFQYSEWYKERFWKSRYSLGSRSYSDIDETQGNFLYNYFEEYMSTEFAFGSTPSFDNGFYQLDCSRIKGLWNDFERWSPVIRTVLNGNIFYANGRGLVSGNFTNLDDYSMFCDKSLDNCYVNVFITTENPVVVQFSGDIPPKCYFAAKDTTCTVLGNNVTVQMHNVPQGHRFRLATIHLQKNGSANLDKGSNAGLIVGICVPIVVLIVICIAIVVFIRNKRKSNENYQNDLVVNV